MVKVTGGGQTPGAVAAHLSYLSHHGALDLETDEGQRVSGQEQKAMLKDWHLEFCSGQYRGPGPTGSGKSGRPVKLVHNIVLSMPAPTPAEKVLAAAEIFAREKFGLQHRYAMALHTHQPHPHVHLVVKAEGVSGQRLHIDKARLREWRQDFAQLMREQGVAANATPRWARGRRKQAASLATYRAKRRGDSRALRAQVASIATELSKTGTICDPGRAKLLDTRKVIVEGWNQVATVLDAQGQVVLAGEVRHFATRLSRVMTDRERLAAQLLQHVRSGKELRKVLTERAR